MPRIRIERASPGETSGGYRDASAPAAPTLRVSFSAFAWWDLFMATIGFVSGGAMLLFVLGETWGPVVAGTLFAYAAAAIFVNRGQITLARGTLRSRLAPIPIFPSKALEAARVRHVVATQQVSSGGWSESTNVSWYVVAILDGDVERVLSRHLRTEEEAKLVARTLEEALGLQPSGDLDGEPWDGTES